MDKTIKFKLLYNSFVTVVYCHSATKPLFCHISCVATNIDAPLHKRYSYTNLVTEKCRSEKIINSLQFRMYIKYNSIT